VLLPCTDLAGGRQVASRIVEGFATSPLSIALEAGSAPQCHTVTLSAGLACADLREAAAAPFDEMGLIARADEALYQAKHAGRSRFVSLV
jgi:PleD family two-component response regulator